MGVSEVIAAGMRETNALFCDNVVAKGDFAVLDKVYTASARILPPGAAMIGGREQIKAFWKQAIAGMAIKSATLTTVDAEQAGDVILEIGQAGLTLAGGQSVDVKYVVHWKQEDGRWKWNVDIWNLNQA